MSSVAVSTASSKPNGYHNGYEIIFYGFKPGGGGAAAWYGERTEEAASDVWQIPRDANQDRIHVTQKPVALPARAIRNHTRPDETVYDPFLGSGSTLIACEELGRRCVALELAPACCDSAVARWQDLTGESPVRHTGSSNGR